MFGLLLIVIRIMNVTEVKCEYWFHHFVKQLFNKKTNVKLRVLYICVNLQSCKWAWTLCLLCQYICLVKYYNCFVLGPSCVALLKKRKSPRLIVWLWNEGEYVQGCCTEGKREWLGSDGRGLLQAWNEKFVFVCIFLKFQTSWIVITKLEWIGWVTEMKPWFSKLICLI